MLSTSFSGLLSAKSKLSRVTSQILSLLSHYLPNLPSSNIYSALHHPHKFCSANVFQMLPFNLCTSAFLTIATCTERSLSCTYTLFLITRDSFPGRASVLWSVGRGGLQTLHTVHSEEWDQPTMMRECSLMEGGRVLVLGGSGNWSQPSRGGGENQRFKDSRGKQDGDHCSG